MNDDFNTSKLIAELFELSTIINKIHSGDLKATDQDIQVIQHIISNYFVHVLGINYQGNETQNSDAVDKLMELIIDIRKSARDNKDWNTSDKIRDTLANAGIEVKDGKNGSTWKI
jgi:cysteinyl-tRNA synthetase